MLQVRPTLSGYAAETAAKGATRPSSACADPPSRHKADIVVGFVIHKLFRIANCAKIGRNTLNIA
jgi:hypothetical protein